MRDDVRAAHAIRQGEPDVKGIGLLVSLNPSSASATISCRTPILLWMKRRMWSAVPSSIGCMADTACNIKNRHHNQSHKRAKASDSQTVLKPHILTTDNIYIIYKYMCGFGSYCSNANGHLLDQSRIDTSGMRFTWIQSWNSGRTALNPGPFQVHTEKRLCGPLRGSWTPR